MNKKVLIIVLVVAIAFLGIVAWGYSSMSGPTRTALATPGALTASTTLYDFGTISMAKGKVDHLFAITNPTGSDIKINTISTSCMCTTAYFVNGTVKDGPFGMSGMGYTYPSTANEVVPADSSREIDVQFDPAAHGPAGIGDIDRLIYIGQEDGGTLQLEIKAVVTP